MPGVLINNAVGRGEDDLRRERELGGNGRVKESNIEVQLCAAASVRRRCFVIETESECLSYPYVKEDKEREIS